MVLKGFLLIGLTVICLLGTSLVAGAATPGPLTPGLTALAPGPLAQVIEGAKKEGTVSVKLRDGLPPASMGRLEKEIRERFGVSLQIKFVPSENIAKDFSQVLMEQKTGAPPTYDVVTLEPAFITDGIKAGVLEKVDWEPLLIEGMTRKAILGTPPQDERLYGYGLLNYTGRLGLMYNPEKIQARDVPKTFSGLADPKWRDRTALFNYVDAWALRAFVEGDKEKVVNDIRAILKNGAIQGRYVEEYNRYLLSEVWLAFISINYFKMALNKGMPAAWQPIDPVQLQEFCAVLVKGLKHPNAAKLITLYLAGPEGARFMLEEGGSGNYLYPGNFEYDAHQQGVKEGFRHFSSAQAKIADFVRTDEYVKWVKEIQLLFRTGK